MINPMFRAYFKESSGNIWGCRSTSLRVRNHPPLPLLQHVLMDAEARLTGVRNFLAVVRVFREMKGTILRVRRIRRLVFRGLY